MRTLTSRKGFTLIELLVVIGILAVLAAIAIPSVAGLIDRANASADATNANEMTNAIERFTSEYELYCQDIASGVIKDGQSGDFDAAQGRVFNVTGATSRADIETLEVAQDAVVADDQIAIYRDTKYPANALTARSIVTNYTKTSSTTFEPKQSDCHYYYSPDCGVVVCQETDSASVEQLNALIQSGMDAKGNQLNEDTQWIDLTDGANAEAMPTEAHGLYFGKIYSATVDGSLIEAIFYENTAADLYVDGAPNASIPAGLIVITKETVDMSAIDFGIGTISLDGKTVAVDNGVILVLDENTQTSKLDGKEFILMNDTSSSFVISHSGINLMQGGQVVDFLPKEFIQKGDDTIIISNTGTPYDGSYKFFDDGYVELNNVVIAKAKDKWLNLNNEVYFVVHEGALYESQDGNVIDSSQAMLFSDIGNMLNAQVDSVIQDRDAFAETYKYRFNRYTDTLLIEHMVDLNAINHMTRDYTNFFFTGRYIDCGQPNFDTKSQNALVTTTRYTAYHNEVTSVREMYVVKVIDGEEVKQNLSSEFTNGVYRATQYKLIGYFKEGVPITNYFTCYGVPMIYEQGMTYGEWLNSPYNSLGELDPDDTNSQYVYIPENRYNDKCSNNDAF